MSDPRAMADTLIRAERARTPVFPFTRTNPFLSTDTAYEAQHLVVEHRLQNGERLVGIELGSTSRVKREALGIQQPVYGRAEPGRTRRWRVRPGGQAESDARLLPNAPINSASRVCEVIVASGSGRSVIAMTSSGAHRRATSRSPSRTVRSEPTIAASSIASTR